MFWSNEKRHLIYNECMTSVDQFIKANKKSSFSDFLLKLMEEKNITAPVLYQRIGMDRKLFSKIISVPDYKPTKKNVCLLALGLQLDAPTSKQFIKRAGYILTSSSPFDLIIRYCIEHKIYHIYEVEKLLDANSLVIR
jgi:hypothetical protein